MSHLLQEADNEIMTNGCFFSLIGLVATQFLVILGYMHINIYFFNLKITLQFSRKQTTPQETEISYKVTKTETVSYPHFITAFEKNTQKVASLKIPPRNQISGTSFQSVCKQYSWKNHPADVLTS